MKRIIIAGLVAVAAALVPASPAHATTTVKVLSWNICGRNCWAVGQAGSQYPGVNFRGETLIRGDKIEHAVLAYDADVVFLQEVCSVQMSEAAGQLADNGYRYGFKSMHLNMPHCNDHVAGSTKYGIGIFTKAPILGLTWTKLPGDPNDPLMSFYILCARTAQFTACGTHLISYSAAIRGPQVAVAKSVLDGIAGPVIFGGDLNTPAGPNSSSQAFYPDFYEADSADNESTMADADKKIDYIFFDKAHFSDATGDSATYGPGSISDHRLLRGTALMS